MDSPASTSRLVLRRFTLADLPTLHAILSDPVTMQFWPAPFDLAATERWVQRSLDAYANGFGRYALILKNSGALIGDAGLMHIDVNGNPENDLGYILDKSYWGQGLATEAAASILEYGKYLGLTRIVASMETKHLASRRVAEKVGFRFEYEFINARNRNLPTSLLAWHPD